jgi:hypothetical protein
VDKSFDAVRDDVHRGNRRRAFEDSGLSTAGPVSSHLAFSIGWDAAYVFLGIPTPDAASTECLDVDRG